MKNKQFKRIYVEITNVCNLECRFCPKTKRAMQFMSIDKFENILIQISPYTDYIYLHVKGEPLLHPNISEILDLCNKYKLKVNLSTNGTLLHQNKDMLILKPAIRQINISLHSIEQNQGHINEEKYINEVLDFIKEYNSKTNGYISLRLWSLTSTTEVKRSNFFLENIRERVFFDQDQEFEWPDMNKSIISTRGKCHALSQQIAILVDGTVVPCCLDNNGDIPLGNIFETDFDSIIKNERFTKILNGFRNRLLVEPLCQRCGFIQQKFK